MSSEETLERVIRRLVEAANLDPGTPLGADTPLVGSGLSLDSVAVLELLVGLEKEFGVEVNPDELLEAGALETVGALAGFIEGKLQGGA